MLRENVCLAALCAGVLGCGSGQPDDRARLRLQAVADPVEAQAYRELVAAFEQEHPQVTVEFVPVARHAEHVARMATAFAGGQPPDLFLINFRRWGQFLDAGVLQPLGPLLAQAGEFRPQDFYAPSLEAFTVQGELLCMPQNISSLVVYWNRTLFRQFGVAPPTADWSWKDFHDAARDLTRDIDGDGRKDVFGLDLEPSIVRLAPFIWQAGGDLVDNLQQPRRFALRNTEAVIGLMFLKRLKTAVGVMPTQSARRAEGPDARFMRGGLGMTLNSRRFTASLRGVPDLDWDVAPLPRYRQAATVLHADAYCLARASRQQAAAAQFVRFATGPTGQTLLAASGRIVAVRRSVARSPAFLDSGKRPDSAQVFLDAVPIMRRTPIVPVWYEVETRINPLIEEWMFEPPRRGRQEPNAGLGDGFRLVQMIEAAAGPLLAAESP